MNFFNRIIAKAHAKALLKHRVRCIYLGMEDAAIVFQAPEMSRQVMVAAIKTSNSIVNTILAQAAVKALSDPSGLTNLRDATQDIATYYGPNTAKVIDAIWLNLPVGNHSPDDDSDSQDPRPPSPAPIKPTLETV